MVKPGLYERDFYAWTREQAALLRSGQLSSADIDHIAEEIESMGRAEKRELVARLAVLLLHLLKWQFQPTHRGASWRLSIANTRDELADLLADNPSLTAQIDAAVGSAYRRARRQAAAETGYGESAFPDLCPYRLAEMMDGDFWPDQS
ncbi:DUF29 domain-containing protein [Rhodospirillum rubrum]|uniref:DUF29 domain-containing protein n=1 Tax=Rhodospirillum rubrum (strain ATCC 11170 / ATH 1.1.1 / DSM 467 / LMG 4362 / NCIMB 8255 / S1) TaxID=269796 RepID=Q2RND1_RHORT|nr:DUF29 domain-containing protein [Rhodospirillum rubrum]ABC24364.1 Protein of unknown function DUF29 [Rhodospirillum rubrum ATCC 11170]AEO50115.1 hypothetical protein F11_18275 [Rhodospirillum rubrum F11]MBK5956086.1 DUF29 domain-containing protein [Rhodospirillum rubrum]QXG80289.1 DUF29 domain-containing protein [Rhodospirillum rubrum]HAQ01004.1 DUF29 domain-containing protein [Rhodospirillum rubrum]